MTIIQNRTFSVCILFISLPPKYYSCPDLPNLFFNRFCIISPFPWASQTWGCAGTGWWSRRPPLDPEWKSRCPSEAAKKLFSIFHQQTIIDHKNCCSGKSGVHQKLQKIIWTLFLFHQQTIIDHKKKSQCPREAENWNFILKIGKS